MTSDDLHFLDFLGSVSKDVQKFTTEFIDATDKHLDHVYHSIRDTLASTPWLPDAARPAPPPPPPSFFRPAPGFLDRMQDWVSRNRALTAAVVAFVGTGAFMVFRQRSGVGRRRRAKRASNGARCEIVVIAGPPSSQIIRSIALDLERRGFIVYVIANSDGEENMITNEYSSGIRSLPLMISDPSLTQQAVERFEELLAKPHQAFPGAASHKLNFTGLIVATGLSFPSGPVDSLSPEVWSDSFNANVLGTIATVQAFLPAIQASKGRLLMLIPNVVASLKPPLHGVESTTVSALEGFTGTLRSELRPCGVDVCHLKMGAFDGLKERRHPQLVNANCSMPARTKGLSRGTHVRTLHNAVFDALSQKRPRLVSKLGKGSVAYDIVGNWLPTGLVGWMLGVRHMSPADVGGEHWGTLTQSWEKVERQD